MHLPLNSFLIKWHNVYRLLSLRKGNWRRWALEPSDCCNLLPREATCLLLTTSASSDVERKSSHLSLFLLLRTLISLQTIHWMANHSISLPWPVMLKKLRVELFYDDLQDLLELTPKRDVLSITGLECKRRKSRNIWSNRQIWPWCTEWGRAKSSRVLLGEHAGHSKHHLPTQEKTLYMDITRWSIPKSDWHHPYGRKWRTKEPLGESERGGWIVGLKLNI